MNIVVFGAGDIAQLAQFYLDRDSAYRVAAFTVDGAYVKEKTFGGVPVVPFEDINKEFPPESFGMFVALSYSQVNQLRAAKYAEAKGRGYKLISYISTKATYFGTPMGDNCFIFEDNTIQPFTTVGNNVTMWSGNHIGHHSVIEDNVFISSHVVISGGVVVKENCFLGVNSTIRDHVTIGARTVIGMGAMITKDCDPDSVYTGAPAQRKSSSKPEELRKI
jgi:sugar O-acyltransferase (sialic acid O-acetyltransferase NeuD family)